MLSFIEEYQRALRGALPTAEVSIRECPASFVYVLTVKYSVTEDQSLVLEQELSCFPYQREIIPEMVEKVVENLRREAEIVRRSQRPALVRALEEDPLEGLEEGQGKGCRSVNYCMVEKFRV